MTAAVAEETAALSAFGSSIGTKCTSGTSGANGAR